MALTRRADLGSLTAEVARLRGRIDSLQRRRADTAVIPVTAELADLFPDGGLSAGSTYALSVSNSLLFALLAQPSSRGSWCAVIGMPEIGTEAAASYGVALERLVLIPDPGDRWMSIVATVAEVVPVIAVRPSTRASGAEIARLEARLRDRGAVLLVLGDWPSAELRIGVAQQRWSGLGEGHGVLRSRSVVLTAQGQRTPRPRVARLQLPTPSGTVGPDHTGASPARPIQRLPQPPLSLVAG